MTGEPLAGFLMMWTGLLGMGTMLPAAAEVPATHSREANAIAVIPAASVTPTLVVVATTVVEDAAEVPALPSKRANAIVVIPVVFLTRLKGAALPVPVAPPASAMPSSAASATVEIPAGLPTSLAKYLRILAHLALAVHAMPSREMSATVEITAASATRPRQETSAVDINC